MQSKWSNVHTMYDIFGTSLNVDFASTWKRPVLLKLYLNTVVSGKRMLRERIQSMAAWGTLFDNFECLSRQKIVTVTSAFLLKSIISGHLKKLKALNARVDRCLRRWEMSWRPWRRKGTGGEVPAWQPYTHAMACARKTCFKYVVLKESIFFCLKKFAFQYVCVTVFSTVLFPK